MAPSTTSPPQSNQTPKELLMSVKTPVFQNKNIKIESISEEVNFSSIKVLAAKPEENQLEDKPTFNEALLTFVLKKEGVSDKFIKLLLTCLDSCGKAELDAHEILVSEFIDYGKSRLVNILKEDFTLKETSYILRHPEHFKESFEKSNRLRTDPKEFFRSNLKNSFQKVGDINDQKDEDDDGDLASPVIIFNKVVESSNTSSVDKRSSRVSLKQKKGKEYSGLKLKTQFFDNHEAPSLKELKNMYPEEEKKTPSKLIRKNTMLMENNVIENDVLHNISCEEVKLKKKLKERLESIIIEAKENNEIIESEIKHLYQLFNYVDRYN